MIQRWQSVFLFLAAIAMAVFTFMPVLRLFTTQGTLTLSALGCGENGVASYLLLILDILIVLLSLITIFKYRDLKQQLRLCNVTILLIIAQLVTIGVMWFMQRDQGVAAYTLWVALPYVSLFFTFWASKRIKADRKLISDSERIR